MDASDGSPSLNRAIVDHYAELPKSERRLADVVLSKGSELHHCQMAELIAEAQVSRATVARFFQRVGFPTFRSAREAARRNEESLVVGTGRPLTEQRAPSLDQLELHLSTDIHNVRHTFHSLPTSLLDDVTHAIASAGKLWIVGFNDDYALAHFARALLIRTSPDIRMIPLGGFSVQEEFASLSADDTLLAYGMHRRPPLLRHILASGKRARMKIFLVTNEHARDEEGVTLLRCRTRGASLFDSLTAAVSLTTFIACQVATAIGEPAVVRLNRIEALHDEWDGIDH